MARLWGTLMLLAAVGLTAGCSCSHIWTAPPVPADVAEAIASVSCASRCHVYIFFVQGHDPVDCVGLEDLKEAAHCLGFDKAWFAPCWYEAKFKKEIARIHHDDPQAHFVLVGYGHGVHTAADLAETVAAQGVNIDLMLCIGKLVEHPNGVLRKVAVLAGCPHEECPDVYYVDTHTHKLPGHPQTAEVLAHELLCIAASIPSAHDLPPMIYPQEPTPHPMPKADTARDEWDFLKPASVDNHAAMPPGSVHDHKFTKR